MPSINGAKYYILLTDQATLRTQYYTYKYKDETFQLFKDQKTMIENELGYKVKIVRLDNRIKFINQKFIDLFKEIGIVQEPTIAYTPKQNSLSEV